MRVMDCLPIQRLVFGVVGLSLLFAPAHSSFGQAQRALLTIDGLSIPNGGALAAFRIDTWGVVPLAVCQVPHLWEIKAETFLDSAAILSGRSDQYHRTFSEIDQVFLVDVYNYQPLHKGDPKTDYHPASFAGWFTVFDGNGDVIKRR
jgi:hypothetical protein